MLYASEFKYILPCMDVCSKYTWVFPLKLKSNVILTFTHFVTAVEVHFSTMVKAVQTDGEGEFTPTTFLFNTKDIIHMLACPGTHHQNESIVHKNMHVVEKNLILLAQASLLLKFWDHACMTTTYLINKMLAPLLNMKSLYFMLYKQVLDYKTLKAFRCASYPHLTPLTSLTLTPKNVCSLVILKTRKDISVFLPMVESTFQNICFLIILDLHTLTLLIFHPLKLFLYHLHIHLPFP